MVNSLTYSNCWLLIAVTGSHQFFNPNLVGPWRDTIRFGDHEWGKNKRQKQKKQLSGLSLDDAYELRARNRTHHTATPQHRRERGRETQWEREKRREEKRREERDTQWQTQFSWRSTLARMLTYIYMFDSLVPLNVWVNVYREWTDRSTNATIYRCSGGKMAKGRRTG